MKSLAIAGALLAAALLAAPTPASAGEFVSFGWNRPAFGYGCGRPSYWGAPPVWAGAYRPYSYPGYYYAPRPYAGAYVPRAYPLFGPSRSWNRVPVPYGGGGYGAGSYHRYR